MYVGGSGNPEAVTVDAAFGVLVGDRWMSFLSTCPGHVPATWVVDRLCECVYLWANDDGGVAAEEADGTRLAVGVGEDDGENEVDFGVRGEGGFLGSCKTSTLALRTCMCKLGGPLSLGGTIRVDVVVSIAVLRASATAKVEFKLLMAVSEPLLEMELVDRFVREPDGGEGIGGMGVVGGFMGGGIIFTASSDPHSTDPDLLSSLDDFEYGNNGPEDVTVLTLAATLFSVGRSDGGAGRAVIVIVDWAGVSDGVFGICLTEFRLLTELQGVKVGKLGGRLSLKPIMGGVPDAPLSVRLLGWFQQSKRERG